MTLLISIIILSPLILYSIYKLNFFFYTILFLIYILSIYELYDKVKQKILLYLLFFLVTFFVYTFLAIRKNDHSGFFECLWLILVVWLSDMGGYIFGKILKGPKLSKYSPSKTINGCIGSIVVSQFSIIILLYNYDDFKLDLIFFFLQFALCVISIFGDLFFSFVKRINNIKDYSNFIPGHGGILDRIDGMIFVFIFYYILTFYINVF